ncbi:MAG: DUF2971 domain-containing protein [Thermodesulfobacteriota bacterium]|jgi:hypothetical protein
MPKFIDVTEGLYKYLNYEGAEKTLENCAVKFSSPIVLNDPFDISIGDILGLEIKEFMQSLPAEFFNFLLNDFDYRNLTSKLKDRKDQIIILNQLLKPLPDDYKKELFAEFIKNPIENRDDWDRLIKITQGIVTEIQKVFNSYGIFCSSKTKDSTLMWSHYGNHHEGVVLKFQPDIKKDSFFLASKSINYSQARPVFYKSSKDLLQSYLTNEPPIDTMIEKIIFTKSLDWAYEMEYRIAIPDLIPNGKKYVTLNFNPKELSAIYFGSRMIDEKKNRLILLAKKLNPGVEFYQASMAKREYALEWVPQFSL